MVSLTRTTRSKTRLSSWRKWASARCQLPARRPLPVPRPPLSQVMPRRLASRLATRRSRFSKPTTRWNLPSLYRNRLRQVCLFFLSDIFGILALLVFICFFCLLIMMFVTVVMASFEIPLFFFVDISKMRFFSKGDRKMFIKLILFRFFRWCYWYVDYFIVYWILSCKIIIEISQS